MWCQASRRGLRPPGQVWHEVSGDVASMIEHTDLFISEKGFLGLGLKNTDASDFVCIFLGGHVPFVLRSQKDGKYQLIGECYVHGVMDGKAMNGINNSDLKDFIII